ncbi:hypothetical protein BU23DRAFT_563457 [Bimuria novae-zelandiae CBS 107.79]|uniref:HAD-like protein n=1 Tax=Bimuria novae-zelandiae CBS 107.79 TaxID=1447943 RepID=A0A6A5VPI1_9PLEO|nr:hypothetical protein BU23DRAFT_563457 [Bimuria novae-zelandiae CBS 107.79]
MFPQHPLEAVIFDLGNVLFTWSAETKTGVPSTVLWKILSSNTWFDYERGRITREACFETVAHEFSLKKSQVVNAFKQANQSLRPDEKVVAFLKDCGSNGKLRVYAMSNFGKEDFVDLKLKIYWSLFDAYLHQNAQHFNSITDNGTWIPDKFAKLLILEVIEGCSSASEEGTRSFFTDRAATLIPGGHFPDDLDTTSLALMVQPPTQPDMVNPLLDRMAQNVVPDGSILVYFDKAKPRTDAVVSSNVLACFHRYSRGQELAATLQYVCGVPSGRSYLQGARYYPSANCCLGFFGRLLESAPNDTEL